MIKRNKKWSKSHLLNKPNKQSHLIAKSLSEIHQTIKYPMNKKLNNYDIDIIIFLENIQKLLNKT